MKKLVAKEYKVSDDQLSTKIGEIYKEGEEYTYFEDPDTGKIYRPKEGFTVEAPKGGDLNDRFVEVNF